MTESIALAHFRLLPAGLASAQLEVNGQDLSHDLVRAVAIYEPGQLPVLQVELRGAGEIEGDGIVRVLLGEQQAELEVSQAVLQWIERLDPTALEQQIASGSMRSGIGAAVLAALRQMAAS